MLAGSADPFADAADTAAVARTGTARPTSRGNWVRRIAGTGYACLLVWITVRFGVPTNRLSLAAIAVTGLGIAGIGRGRAYVVGLLRDWLPFTAVLVVYDQTRGLADALGISVHETDVLAAERWLFGGVEPTVWLQHHLYRPGRVFWYDAAATLVYTSHFIATPLLAVVLWLRDRANWLWFIKRVVALSAAGLVSYGAFPEAPPWMAARDGWSAPVARLSARGWLWLHAGDVDSLLARAQSAGSNPVAAMPSVHAAFATLIAITLITRLRSRWRYAAVAYPAAMSFVLVYTGEHYVLDIAAGVGYAVTVHLLVNRWARR